MRKRKRQNQRISFNLNIYRREAIQEAVSAFSSFAEFRKHPKNGRVEVEIAPNASSVSQKKRIADEFSNYVLGMTKKCL